MKWVKSLTFQNENSVEQRLSSILTFLSTHYQISECYASSVDATGKLGNKLTQELNVINEMKIDLSDLIRLVEEDGQIFDMELKIKAPSNFLIIVQDGQYIDILDNDEELPSHVIEDHINLDMSHYNF